jgi:hypothetical protein
MHELSQPVSCANDFVQEFEPRSCGKYWSRRVDRSRWEKGINVAKEC